MKQEAHLALAPASALLVLSFAPTHPLLVLLGALLGCTFPDVIDRITGWRHRTHSHTVLYWLPPLGAAVWLGHPLALGMLVAVLVHLIADVMTVTGIPILPSRVFSFSWTRNNDPNAWKYITGINLFSIILWGIATELTWLLK